MKFWFQYFFFLLFLAAGMQTSTPKFKFKWFRGPPAGAEAFHQLPFLLVPRAAESKISIFFGT